LLGRKKYFWDVSLTCVRRGGGKREGVREGKGEKGKERERDWERDWEGDWESERARESAGCEEKFETNGPEGIALASRRVRVSWYDWMCGKFCVSGFGFQTKE